MGRRKRFVALVGAVLAVATTLTACSSGACPAVMYINSVDVATSGDFATLDACAGGACVNSADESTDPELFTVTGGPGSWVVGPFASAPAKISLRARDDTGKSIAEEAYELDWKRTGGSEECGGPMETPALEFDVVAPA